MPLDFSEFPPLSKAAWLEQVSRDLKGKTLESLYWQPEAGLDISPFVQAEDFPEPPEPLTTGPHYWEICEAVDAAHPEAANRQALEALQFGAEALQFELPFADTTSLRTLLQGVYLDFVSLHFAGPAVDHNPGAVLTALHQVATENGLTMAQLRGSLAYDPVKSAQLVDWRYLAELITLARTDFPGFRLVLIGSAEMPTDPVEQLVQMLQQGNFYLQKLTARGLSVAEAAGTLSFQITIGKSYFLEIARIRAFKALWLNVLQAWEAPLVYAPLTAMFLPEAYSDDLYTNMVRGTTMAMSAAVGGVDRLTVRPYADGREDPSGYSPEFGRRIARNVQHLLKMESGFDQLSDPAAGSYYLENLTGQLCQAAWTRFQQFLI